MEEELQFQTTQPLLLGGGGESYSAAAAVDEAYFNGVYAGLSFSSLLTYGSSSVDPTGGGTPRSTNLLRIPKSEPLFAVHSDVSAEAPPYNFFSEDAAAASSSSLHHQLPNLFSLEIPPPQKTPAAVVESSPLMANPKQRRRRQQQRLSDKTRSLQKLLPWDEKMDMATVLEKAYKYIRFLQAQVSVLQSMPYESSGAAGYGTTATIDGGDLGKLNRQQLLQVVVNSPVAQAQLYSQGCCLYSAEQLVLLKWNVERKALNQQLMFGSNSSNPSSLHS